MNASLKSFDSLKNPWHTSFMYR